MLMAEALKSSSCISNTSHASLSFFSPLKPLRVLQDLGLV